jgi:hypothetical protein
MAEAKPDGWDQSLKDMIATGKNWKACNKELIALYGEEGKLGNSTFQRHKKDLTGGPEVDQGLKALGERKQGEKSQKKKLPAWNKGKQKVADETKLAQLINKGMYHSLFPFCKNKELKEADVQEVNLGGGVVGAVQYYVPDLNLDHPIIILLTRGIMLYLTFKRICGKIAVIKEKITNIGGGVSGGVKPEFVAEEK